MATKKIKLYHSGLPSATAPTDSMSVISTDGSADKQIPLESLATYTRDKLTDLDAAVADISDIQHGYTKHDITDTLTMKDGACWYSGQRNAAGQFPLSEWKMYDRGAIWEGICAFEAVDISLYDAVEVSRVDSGTGKSTSNQLVSGLHIFLNGTSVLNTNAPVTYIVYPQRYRTKDTDVVTMLFTCNKTYAAPKVLVTQRTFRETPRATEIAFVGDSLLGNPSALVCKEFSNIVAPYLYEVTMRSQGGESMAGNLTRAGGLPLRASEAFELAASGASAIKLCSGWRRSDGTFAKISYNGGCTSRPVRIAGVDGKLTQLSAVCAVTYDSSKAKVGVYTSTTLNNISIPSGVAYIRFSANNPQTGVTHITIGGEAKDVDELLTIDGALQSDGRVSTNVAYKTSDFIEVSEGTTIYADALATSGSYTFVRDEDGTSDRTIGAGNIGYDSALYEDANAIHIWFTGQNGGYDSAEEWCDMVEQASKNFSNKFLVLSTALERTTDELAHAAAARFGKRYINLRDYTQNQAIYDGIAMGLVASDKTAADYAAVFWPSSDKVHQDAVLSYLWSVLIWNTLIDFGWIDGTPVTDGSFFVK